MAERQAQVLDDALYQVRVDVYAEEVGQGLALGGLCEFQVGRLALEGQFAVDGHVAGPLVLASVGDEVYVDVARKENGSEISSWLIFFLHGFSLLIFERLT